MRGVFTCVWVGERVHHAPHESPLPVFHGERARVRGGRESDACRARRIQVDCDGG